VDASGLNGIAVPKRSATVPTLSDSPLEAIRGQCFCVFLRREQGSSDPWKQTHERWALQAAEKLIETAIPDGFVTGHDFSRADKAHQINVGL
jgi:hypothetical protein